MGTKRARRVVLWGGSVDGSVVQVEAEDGRLPEFMRVRSTVGTEDLGVLVYVRARWSSRGLPVYQLYNH